MFSFLERVSSNKKSSKDLAKERLKLVLIHDRIDMPREKLEDLKNELLSVISRYVDIETSMVKIDIARDERQQRLIADIPLKTATSNKIRK